MNDDLLREYNYQKCKKNKLHCLPTNARQNSPSHLLFGLKCYGIILDADEMINDRFKDGTFKCVLVSTVYPRQTRPFPNHGSQNAFSQ